MNITKGVIQKAKKVVVYGPEGIGKSTFASKFPNPLFIDTEGSTASMDVARLATPSSWQMLLSDINDIIHERPCQTLVIDTADWAERLCIEHICATHDKKGIEDFGYGNGYTYVAEEWGRFLNKLQEVVDIAKINIVLTAHAIIRKFEQPNEMGAYDRYELKLGKKTTGQTAPLTKEWADMVLFANYLTYSVATDDKGKKHKAQGGKRVMYTSHHPCWDAKNRSNLPEQLDFDYSTIAHLFADMSQVAQAIPQTTPVLQPVLETSIQKEVQQLNINDYAEPQIHTTQLNTQLDDYNGLPQALIDLMKKDNINEEMIRKAVHQKTGIYPLDMPVKDYDSGFIQGVLVGAWSQIVSYINANLMPY